MVRLASTIGSVNTFVAITITSVVSAGVVGGVFLAFSTFVMRALAQLPAEQGIAAMQRINIVVINPWFMGVFFGATPLLGLAAYAARITAQAHASSWLATAFAIYLLGSIGVTIVCNVPRNDRLAKLAPTSAEAETYWPMYVRQWLFWNHIRCIAAIVAAALGAVGLAVSVGGLQHAA